MAAHAPPTVKAGKSVLGSAALALTFVGFGDMRVIGDLSLSTLGGMRQAKARPEGLGARVGGEELTVSIDSAFPGFGCAGNRREMRSWEVLACFLVCFSKKQL